MLTRLTPIAKKEQKMRAYTFFYRLCVLACLIAGSALMAGWKWDRIPH